MYTVHQFGGMVRDKVRVQAYAQALKQAITPDSVVLDIGTGTGFFAFLACQYGARHVYAIEEAAPIYVAQQSARDNGYADRITFIQGLSTNIELPEKADVLVADLRGRLPLTSYNLPSIADARERLLKPNAVIIPQRDKVYVAPVQLPTRWYHTNAREPWFENDYQIDLSAGYRYAASEVVSNLGPQLAQTRLLAEGQLFAELNYYHATEYSFTQRHTWTITQAGEFNGYLMWFDSETADGIGYSAHPTHPERPNVYGDMGLLLEKSFPVEVGETVQGYLQARLSNEHYIYGWDTTYQAPDGQTHRLKQSMFTYESLNKLNSLRHKPTTSTGTTLNAKGQALTQTLEALQQGIPYARISAQLVKRFPNLFTNEDAALEFAHEMKRTYLA